MTVLLGAADDAVLLGEIPAISGEDVIAEEDLPTRIVQSLLGS
eukprot:CAMPEP_0194523032 /NCGR_PEP_ID=MMETSP0253-20130528/57808_1 /TAXON_ID=2966 /ORGANISM="Noctiluca scintillans" /LENGTH=42 /DNA_ID= /DNA_START= /DNA_END= /DNA_ORIENTATION=